MFQEFWGFHIRVQRDTVVVIRRLNPLFQGREVFEEALILVVVLILTTTVAAEAAV